MFNAEKAPRQKGFVGGFVEKSHILYSLNKNKDRIEAVIQTRQKKKKIRPMKLKREKARSTCSKGRDHQAANA